MSVLPTYPGVYVQELPSGVRAIAGVATSIGVIVGTFGRGPVDVALAAFGLSAFERDFGAEFAASEASYQAKQFFLNGGSQLIAVRVAPGATAASATLDHNDPGGAAETLLATAGRSVRGAASTDPGSWGNNLRIDVDHAAVDAINGFNLTVSEVRIDNGREIIVQTESFQNLAMVEGPRNAIDIVNAQSQLIQLSRDAAWLPGRPAATGTVSDPVDVAGFAGMPFANTLDVTIGGVTSAVVIPPLSAPLATLSEARAVLERALRAARSTDPLYAGATVQLTPDGRLRVLAGRSGFGYAPDLVVSFADNVGDFAQRLSLRATDNAIENVQQYALGSAAAPVGFQGGATAGTDTSVLTASDLLGTRGGKTGVFALEDVDLFNILMIPEAATFGSVADLALVMDGAIDYCVERRAFALIDVPPSVASFDQALAWLEDITAAGLRNGNAASYFPCVRVSDVLDGGQPRSIGSSGTVAGIYARTDAARGVWKAPVGIATSLSGVVGLDCTLTDAEHGQLNPLGLNALRTFNIAGTVIWGARSLVGADALASDWKYAPVRRLALFVEESLRRGLQWVVFEPNDAPLWAQMRVAAETFLQDLFRQGAFQGASASRAFFVKCDGETTTQDDVDAGIVKILIGFAPLKPSEFVVINLQFLACHGQP